MTRTKIHRILKWAWIVVGVPVSFILRESLGWIVFMSVYAIIASHWAAEEAAD